MKEIILLLLFVLGLCCIYDWDNNTVADFDVRADKYDKCLSGSLDWVQYKGDITNTYFSASNGIADSGSWNIKNLFIYYHTNLKYCLSIANGINSNYTVMHYTYGGSQ